MIDRKKIKKCPLCGSGDIAHISGKHISRLHGISYNVHQTVCHECGEVFLGTDSLEVIRMNKRKVIEKRCYNHRSLLQPIDIKDGIIPDCYR
ncbi:MAG: hypothetical protein BWK80_23730 [Desulfobacteraceae bacterium IS3]|nr:MAG: hypothetical protein BWK80_23730 [Desulfobacteraceae bacterium IS3]HAO19236.1 hypothetical protein [Desulfobacteraceae bacterium]